MIPAPILPAARAAHAVALSITKVCEFTGLERAEIYRAAELAQLGCPKHFVYQGGQVVYLPAGLDELGEAIDRLGFAQAARFLRAARSHLGNPERRGRGFTWLGTWQAETE